MRKIVVGMAAHIARSGWNCICRGVRISELLLLKLRNLYCQYSSAVIKKFHGKSVHLKWEQRKHESRFAHRNMMLLITFRECRTQCMQSCSGRWVSWNFALSLSGLCDSIDCFLEWFHFRPHLHLTTRLLRFAADPVAEDFSMASPWLQVLV